MPLVLAIEPLLEHEWMGRLLLVHGVVCVSVCSQSFFESHVIWVCFACCISDWRIPSVDRIAHHSGTLEPSRHLDFDGR